MQQRVAEETRVADNSKAPDRSAIEHIVREHSGWMLGLCRRILGEYASAEDGVQEALISAFRNLPKLEEPSAIKAWLYKITLNHCLQILRRRVRMKEELPGDLMPAFDASGCRIEPSWDHFESPDQLLQRADIRSRVLTKIDQLPTQYRLVIMLRDIEELSTSETAEILQISEENAKVRLHRARAGLKSLLEPLMRGEV